jgi:precorrin-6Y C5,15-methyltransferase (decarboxylating), cbiT subunit
MKDSEFIRDSKVPMTKEEVRAVSLSYLDIHNKKNFLDIGAGSGSCFLEALVTNKNLTATAIESNEDAINLIKQNIENFENIYGNIKNRTTLIHAMSPIALDEKFDAIFIGGTRGNMDDIIKHCLSICEENAVIVINLITVENFSLLMQILAENKDIKAYSVSQLSINKMDTLGRYSYLKPLNPIFIIKIEV